MALDAGSFKVAIEALPNGSELMAYHVSAVEAEKTRGIDESRKANAEAQNLRRFKIAVEKLGYQKDQDLDAFMDTLKVATTKAADADTAKLTLEQVTAELNKLKADYSKTVTELGAEKERAQEIQTQAIRRTLKSKLVSLLEPKVYGHDYVADSLINDGRVALGDNETLEFVDGDKRVNANEGLRRLLEQRTDIVKNGQRPGAGTAAPTGGTSQKFTLEQIQAMDKATIRANLPDVKASLGITV